MVDSGVPVASIVFLVVFYMCCFCCIGCCVWACKKRKKNAEKIDELDIEIANIDEYEEKKKTVVMTELQTHPFEATPNDNAG